MKFPNAGRLEISGNDVGHSCLIDYLEILVNSLGVLLGITTRIAYYARNNVQYGTSS